MVDQADGLRKMVQTHPAHAPREGQATPGPRNAGPAARSLVFTSGKGGVGTSNVVLNLAIALGEFGQRVVLVDADLGLANIDLLCGLTPAADLGTLLAEGRGLSEALVRGPGEIRILPGAHGMRTLAAQLAEGSSRLARELKGLEEDADFLLVDAGSGLGPNIAQLAAAADQVVVVTTPEPTSLADAHAAFQRLKRPAGAPALRVVVNQAASSAEAAQVLARLVASSREFLGLVVQPLGYVNADSHVPRAVRQRRPVMTRYPRSSAARCIRRLAQALIEERQPRARPVGRFAAISARWALSRVAQ